MFSSLYEEVGSSELREKKKEREWENHKLHVKLSETYAEEKNKTESRSQAHLDMTKEKVRIFL